MRVDRKKIFYCVFAILSVLLLMISQNSIRKRELSNLLSSDVEDEALYTPITYQEYVESYEAATIVINDPLASNEEIDKIAADLQNSISKLQYIPSKDHLNQLYSQALSIAPEDYIPLTFQPLQNAIEYAYTVLNNENAISDEVDEAASQIEASMLALVERPDKTELSDLVDDAKSLDDALYLPSTYQNVAHAINHAKGVLINENAFIEDVSNALNLLKQSLDGLVEKPDKTTLGILIEQANGISADQYTTASYTALVSELTIAKKVYKNVDSTQNDVIVSENALQDSMSSLVETTKGVFRLSVRFSRESNNHVGNSWSYGAFYLDKDIDGETVTMAYDSNIELYCEIIEADNYPDIGCGYLHLVLVDGAERSITISVYENRGRYSGNRAVWTVTASVTLIERI